jgi:hypothetical protein
MDIYFSWFIVGCWFDYDDEHRSAVKLAEHEHDVVFLPLSGLVSVTEE